MRSNAKCYDALRAYLQSVPLIDCHDHSAELGAKPKDPIRAVIDWYMQADLESAVQNLDVKLIFDADRPLEERWPVLETAWKRSKYSGYGMVVRRTLQHFYCEDDLSLAALQRMQGKLVDISDPQIFEAVLDQAGIRVRIEDVWFNAGALDGRLKLPPRSRLAISWPAYHAVKNYE